MAKSLIISQPKIKRIKNFEEVSLGYTRQMAIDQARNFPQARDPSHVPHCPLGIDIPGFVRFIREGDMRTALGKIKEHNDLPSICGRICDAPCEKRFMIDNKHAAVGIRALERFAADHGKQRFFTRKPVQRSGKRVAIIGSGSAGLMAAARLAKKGYQVTIFEALPQAGGALRCGLPDFRLPKDVLKREIDEIKLLGVTIETNCYFGSTITADEIFSQGYEAILLAVGTGGPQFLNIPGTNLGGVYYSEELLMQLNFLKLDALKSQNNVRLGNKIAILGTEMTALDCARACVRLGKDVCIIHPQTDEELNFDDQEREYAQQEGIQFESLTKPIELIADGKKHVSGVKCLRMDFADPDSNGEWKILPLPDSDFVFAADTVILACGRKPPSVIKKIFPNIKLNADKTVWVNEQTQMTSIENVFAAGDMLTGGGPVIEALVSGKNAAESIDHYLTGGH